MKNFAKSCFALTILALPVVLAPPVFGQAPHLPTITSISVCSPSGTGGQGSCPSGTLDTIQDVLGPNGGSVNASSLGAVIEPDEHSSVFAPGALGANSEYLFFLAGPLGGNPGVGVSVLSGGSGPNNKGQWILDLPRADGYGSYPGGFGQVFTHPDKGPVCPTVPDGNPAHQDQTFDLNYAASGSIVKDPTASPGSFLMIYEGTNNCIANAGGPTIGSGDSYISLAVATSLDYGKTWPTYRGTATYTFDPLPGTNGTTGPNAPMGAFGKNVCMENDCSTTPPATYGRYPIATKTTSLASLMASGQAPTSNFGYQEISGFVDDIAGGPAPYIYALAGAAVEARAQLNGGTAPLSFLKWNGKAFDSPGIGGADASVLPVRPFQNCEARAQSQYGSSISYVEATRQYLLTFVCISAGDPALGPGNGGPQGGAWFYATSYDLSDPTTWTPPQEITGTWSPIDTAGGCAAWNGYYPTFMSVGEKPAHLSTTGFVFSLSGCQGGGTAPPKRRMSARGFTMTLSQACPVSFSAGGQSLPAAGGSVTVSVVTAANCPWSVGQLPSWITAVGASSGTGPGSVTLNVAPNAGGDQSASIAIGGTPFEIEQQAAHISGLNFIGSMPHLAAEGGWLTTFTFVNKSSTPATSRTNLFSPAGAALQLPIALPQQSAIDGDVLASSLDQVIAPNAQFVMQATGPANVAYVEGSAQLAATSNVDGFAIFNFNPNNQEAVVSMETRNAASYVLPLDNTNGVLTGVALENVSANGAVISVVIRDDTGKPLLNSSITLNGAGHTSFVLSTQFAVTANVRGTIEFDTPGFGSSNAGQISVLGIRYTGGTLTTIPVLANVGNGGGLMAHLASGAGWQTTFVLVNTGATSAQATLKFFGDTGAALALPLTFPQGAAATTTATYNTPILAAGASYWIQSTGAITSALLTGSAQLSTTGNISGFVIFRYNPNGQEAVVPLESRNASSYVLAFDNTAGTVTGVALSLSSAQNANVALILRDDTGTQIGTSSLPLSANGHASFTLADPTHGFPVTANIRGTAEFVAQLGAQISVLGIRSPPALTFTTLPALAK
jgi:hypothetical protein